MRSSFDFNKMVRVTTKVQCNEMFLLQNYLLGAETHLFLKVLPETDQTKNTSLTKSFSDLPIYWYHHRWTPTMVCFSLVISNQCGQTKNTISSKKKCLFGGQFFFDECCTYKLVPTPLMRNIYIYHLTNKT